MDAKESALQKLEAILSLGPPSLLDMPDYGITPSHLARLKARCAKIAPFKPAVSVDVMKAIVLRLIDNKRGGWTAQVINVPQVLPKQVKAITKELVHDGYLTADTKMKKVKKAISSYNVTEAGRRFLDSRMENPEIAKLLKELAP